MLSSPPIVVSPAFLAVSAAFNELDAVASVVCKSRLVSSLKFQAGVCLGCKASETRRCFTVDGVGGNGAVNENVELDGRIVVAADMAVTEVRHT